MIHVTLFNSRYDSKTNKTFNFLKWKSFENWLEKLYKIKTIKPEMDDIISFYHAPLISPAVYAPDTTRANDNVLKWSSWAALDVDDYSLDLNFYKDFGDCYYIIYNTAGSTEEHPKFRLIVPLTREVDSEEFENFWYALKKYFKVGDEQTKDMARMFYVPGQYPDAYSFFIVREGAFLDPDNIMIKYPKPKEQIKDIMDALTPEIKKELLSRRKDGFDKRNIKWSSYKDCPFINKRYILEYKSISGTGWYAKLYQIMVSIACRAYKAGYPISISEIEDICRELDSDTGNWYLKRPIKKEAQRAINFALKHI